MSSSKTKINQRVILIAICISILGSLLSLFLTCKHTGICTSSFGCSLNGIDGCAELGGSKYSKVILPFVNIQISIAILGFFYYTLLALLFFNLKRIKEVFYNATLSMITGFVIFGFVFDLFLAYRNFFILSVPCLMCVYTYLCQISLLGIVFWMYFDPIASSARQRTNKNQVRVSFIELLKNNFISIIGTFLLTLIVFFIFQKKSKSYSEDIKTPNLGLLPKNDVAQVLKEFRSLKQIVIPTKNVNTFEGDEQAYILIQEWYDFRCPHCRHLSEVLQEAMNRWPGRIKVYYRQFPLDGTCNPVIKQKQPAGESCKASQAVVCASANNDVFVKMVHGLFNFQITQTHIDLASLAKLSIDSGANWEEIKSCMNKPATFAFIHRDIQAGEKININSTPTMTIDDFLLPAGVPDKAWFFRLLDALVLEKEGDDAVVDFTNRASSPSN